MRSARRPHSRRQPEHITTQATRTVAQLEPGESAVVIRVPDGDPELLRYLAELALVPGDAVELTAIALFGGPATVRTITGEHAIARELAATIDVV